MTRLLRRHFHLTGFPIHPMYVEYSRLWGAYAFGPVGLCRVQPPRGLYFYLRDWTFWFFASPLQTKTRNLSGLPISNSFHVAVISYWSHQIDLEFLGVFIWRRRRIGWDNTVTTTDAKRKTCFRTNSWRLLLTRQRSVHLRYCRHSLDCLQVVLCFFISRLPTGGPSSLHSLLLTGGF